MHKLLILGLVLCLSISCSHSSHSELTASGLNPQLFIDTIQGKPVALYQLTNANGMEVCITNYGGRIVSVMVPDKFGVMRDVVLGFDSLADYLQHRNSYGATIGRYVNRIAHGVFELDGKSYQLPIDRNGHCIHGGPQGFRFQVFDVRQISNNSLQLSYVSKDGESGFPGNLICNVTFTVTTDNAIDIHYTATTDRPTVVNLTNHSFFNLDGDPTQSNIHYILQVAADSYTPIDESRLPTGDIASLEGESFDFRTPRTLQEAFHSSNTQITKAHGIDLNYVLNTKGDITQPSAVVYSTKSGIKLQVYTNEPGLQVAASYKTKGEVLGKKGILYNHRSSICLEAQKFPDSPNHPSWPSAELRPGEQYDTRCIYKFSVAK